MASDQERLDNLNTLIDARIAGGAVDELTVDGQSLKNTPLDKLMKMRDELEGRIAMVDARTGAVGGSMSASFRREC